MFLTYVSVLNNVHDMCQINIACFMTSRLSRALFVRLLVYGVEN
jgi:hypothetical protein